MDTPRRHRASKLGAIILCLASIAAVAALIVDGLH